MNYRLYHYHLEHATRGQIGCIFVACHPDAAAETVQAVADGVIKRAYERVEASPMAQADYRAGLITMVRKDDSEPLALPVSEPQLRDLQMLGALTGDVLILIEGDEQLPAPKSQALQPLSLFATSLN